MKGKFNMTYPQDYPRLTFKLKKDENGKVVLDSNGNPTKVYLLFNKERTAYRELTEEEVDKMFPLNEEKKGN